MLDRMERKLGRYAVKELMLYIVILNLAVFLSQFIDPDKVFLQMLQLDPALILKGQIWRIVSFIFIPPTLSPLWIIFTLYLYYLFGSGLEHEWGSFKFNIYYFLGMIGTIIGSFIIGTGAPSLYLNMSIMFAFAFIYPNFELLIFFVLPVKIKYLAWLNWAFFAFSFFTSPFNHKIAILIAVLNYFLFFGKEIVLRLKDKRGTYYRRQSFNAKWDKDAPIHTCHVCGITEKQNPQMDFRYCSECKGDYEYCMDHLENHEHYQ